MVEIGNDYTVYTFYSGVAYRKHLQVATSPQLKFNSTQTNEFKINIKIAEDRKEGGNDLMILQVKVKNQL